MSPTPSWLQVALDYLPQWIGYQVRATEVPGCVVSVGYGGLRIFNQAWGCADLSTNAPLTVGHRFRVASHSKTFTAVALLKLREQGLVGLDDPVGRHVDKLHPDVASATIAQVLSNSAGIVRDGFDSGYWAGRSPFPDAADLRRDLLEPPTIAAASRLKYSNHGFGLAGLAIESITGEPFADWVEREVLRPLGLDDTFVDVPSHGVERLAQGHSGKTLLGRRLVFPGGQSTQALAPATGFISTAADLVEFYGQLDPDADTDLLTPASRRELVRRQWTASHTLEPFFYGLGTVSGDVDDWQWFGHSGGFQGYITQTIVIAGQQLAISVLTNAIDGPAHSWAQGVAKILKRYKSEGAPAGDNADWRGRWWSVWGPVDLVPMGDKVLMAMPGMGDPFLKATELRVEGPDAARVIEGDSFGIFGEEATRIRDETGAITAIQLGSGTFVPEQALAGELVGRYEGTAV